MKRILIAIVFIFCLFSFSSCSKKTPVETNTPSNESTAPIKQELPKADPSAAESKDKDVTIEIVPPVGWTPVENAITPIHYIKETASFIVKTEPYQSNDLDGVASECKAAFEGVFQDVNVASIEKLTIDGRDARKMIFTYNISGLKMKSEYNFLFIGNKVYIIIFGDTADTFDALTSDYEQIIGAIHFK